MFTAKFGRAERPQGKKGVNTALATAIVLGAGMALPLVGAYSANAATDSQWEAVAVKEASGNWNINYSGDGLSVGGLQFQNPSWKDALSYLRSQGIDTSGFPSSLYQGMSGVPTKAQQMLAGEALLHLQGRGAWANGNGVVLSNSMFDGGPIPSTVASSGLLNGTKWGSSSSSSDTPKSETPKSETPKSETPKPSTSTSGKYTVKRGDYLTKIATEQNVDGGWQALYSANKSVIGPNPNMIHPGQKLTLPAVKYTVKKGDYLTKIASNLGIDGGWKALYDKNKDVIGDNPNLIEPGMVLVVTGLGSGSPAPSTPSTPATPSKPSTPDTSDNSTPSTNGWVSPLAKGSYVKGDNVVGNGSCISRTCGGHSGLDMSAKQGTPVKAIASGTVVFAGYGYADPSGAYGLEIILKLPDGKYALYGHLSAKTVSTGDKVSAGQMIGNVGSTGNSSGAHLHFEIRNDPKAFAVGVFLNPVTYMASKGVTL